MLINPKQHPDYNWKPRTEPQWFVIVESWVNRTNRLYAYWQNKENDAPKREKAKTLYEKMNARIIMIFANIIKTRMAMAQARQKIITDPSQMPKRRIPTLVNDQRSRLFNRRFKK